jgi:hypothetical protein
VDSQLARIAPLPSSGRPVTSWRSVDDALPDVARGVNLACRALLRGSSTTGSSTPPGTIVRLVEVFKQSGIPSLTFVEPADFYRLRLALNSQAPRPRGDARGVSG